jgi:hypothetical protein
MTQDMEKKHILQMGSDKMIPRHICDKPFMIRFSDRSECKKGSQPNRKWGIIWHTNGSKRCNATEQGGNSVLALGNTHQYSGQDYKPLRLVQ